MRWWLIVGVAGCIHTDSVVCDDGLICPGGTVCAEVTNPSAELCVTPDQISACVGKAPLDTCELTGAAIARCYDGVCLPAGCGNGRVDPDEACDDGNSVIGDGCSAGCQSNETCGNGIVDPVKIVNGVAQPDEQCDDKNNVSGDGCSSDCQLESAQWQQLTASLPGARETSAMAYDSARGRVVLFGGATKFGSALIVGPTSVLGDTWEWDGTGWISTSIPVSPGARTGHAMAYDAARRRVVLFGGSGSTTFGDTWLYDGVTWTLLNPAHAPTPRASAAAAYDSARQKLVLFGGVDATGTTNAETWEWDGTDWTQVQLPGAPPARSGAVMAYDPVRAVVVMAGGNLSDTWEYDGTQWRDVTPSAANQTDQTADFGMAYDRVSGKIVINGPATSGTGTDTWGWNGQVWTKLLAGSASTPSYRSDMTMVGDPVHGTVILVGGDASIGLCFPHALYNCLTTLNDAWTWNGSTWSAVAVAAPPPLAFVASAFDSWRGRLVIFGGESAGPTYSGATWEFDGGHWTLRTTPTAPSSRQNTVMAFDAIHHKIVLFGGFDNNTSQALGDTWSWDGTTWTQLFPTTVVPPRYSQTMAFDPVRGRVVMFGGDPASTHDTWEWDGTNWIATSPATDPGFGVDAASMTYDPIRQRMVLTEGSGSGEIWEWDGASWTLLDPIETPGTRANAATAWNAPRRRIELFGGGYNSSYNDLWEWDGTGWTPQFPIGAPEARVAHSLTTSPDGVGVLLYGGLDSTTDTFLGDLWRLRWTSTQATELCTLDVDNDGDGLAGCADPDCWATCTPLCPPGVTCDPSWPHCGDGTCSPVENCRNCPRDCGACTAICGDTFCDAPETHGSCPGDCP